MRLIEVDLLANMLSLHKTTTRQRRSTYLRCIITTVIIILVLIEQRHSGHTHTALNNAMQCNNVLLYVANAHTNI